MTASLTEALAALFEFAGQRLPGRSSLAMMRRAMALLGDPQERLRVIHVTGTSGKTSTCYYIRALLEAAGRRTGLTVSPHVEALNERVQLDGIPLDEEVFCDRLDRLFERLEPLRGQLTYFELVVCLALWVFAWQEVDYAVVEVGVGGREDATNVAFRPDKVSVIGPVGLDHTDRLGATIPEIAAHKAGILVPGGVGFVARQPAPALRVIEDRAAAVGARLTVVEETAGSDPRIDPGLPVFQQRNWAMALAVVASLAARDGFDPPDPATVRRLTRSAALGCEAGGGRRQPIRVTPPARYEWFQLPGHRVLLDGAHNPQKMTGLVETVQAQGLGPFPALATLSQAGEDKVAATVAALAPVVSRLIVPEFALGQAGKVKASVPAAVMARAAADQGIETRIVPSPRAAWAALLEDPAPDLLVTGSLYLASLVRPWLVAASR